MFHSLNPLPFTNANGVCGVFKILMGRQGIMERGWVSSKMGEGEIHSKVILAPQKILNKTSNFWSSVLKKILAIVFQNWRKIHFLLHCHVCCFKINRYEWMKVFYGVFKFWVQIKKILVKSPIEVLCFSLLWIINTEKVSLQKDTKFKADSINVFC